MNQLTGNSVRKMLFLKLSINRLEKQIARLRMRRATQMLGSREASTSTETSLKSGKNVRPRRRSPEEMRSAFSLLKELTSLSKKLRVRKKVYLRTRACIRLRRN